MAHFQRQHATALPGPAAQSLRLLPRANAGHTEGARFATKSQSPCMGLKSNPSLPRSYPPSPASDSLQFTSSSFYLGSLRASPVPTSQASPTLLGNSKVRECPWADNQPPRLGRVQSWLNRALSEASRDQSRPQPQRAESEEKLHSFPLSVAFFNQQGTET